MIMIFWHSVVKHLADRSAPVSHSPVVMYSLECRYSIAYFANARTSTKFQGPSKKYPEITISEVSGCFLL